jgi:diaminohydroxyphosphoribosylaminopyrimidine deaminase / 5-amino-6-(5-phosphoribosylamino)uracil reductase
VLIDEKYMRRCFDLARLGAQTVSPNPMVGAVIVHDNIIIGEGFHHTRGEAHAEVNAIAAVSARDKTKIPDSEIYVSLEPCCHQGLTPACTDLILTSGIKQVVISVIDPNPEVSGRGIKELRRHGVAVTTGVLEEEGNLLLAHFRSSKTRGRPYVILKFVQSRDRYIGHPEHQVWLSNDIVQVLVHKLRSEVDGVVVGTNTVVIDNPQLTNREYFGRNPVRITFDRNLRIPKNVHLLDDSVPTLVYTEGLVPSVLDPEVHGKDQAEDPIMEQQEAQSMPLPEAPELAQNEVKSTEQVEYVPLTFDQKMLHTCLDDLGKRDIQSILVEGGAGLINSFVKNELWDEAWVVTTKHVFGQGVKAPLLRGHLVQKFCLDTDEIQIIKRI